MADTHPSETGVSLFLSAVVVTLSSSEIDVVLVIWVRFLVAAQAMLHFLLVIERNVHVKEEVLQRVWVAIVEGNELQHVVLLEQRSDGLGVAQFERREKMRAVSGGEDEAD